MLQLFSCLLFVAAATTNHALSQFLLTSFSGPRPDPVVYLERRIYMIKFKIVAPAAVHTRTMLIKPVSATSCYPFALVLALSRRILERHCGIVSHEPALPHLESNQDQPVNGRPLCP